MTALVPHAITLGWLLSLHSIALAQIPHHQDKVPNKPYEPAVALTKMTVPEGFTVELVAAEPDIVNPIGMAFDAQGRIWITESLEYPRRSAGKGRDRIKVLQDTDHDGKVDKVTVFADGLNIPSGIAVGHGGVWVANAPDLLFMRDTDGDLKADQTEVIATGFGRQDVHEVPNSLTWGPDGYLYGLNGVFNHCHVTQDLNRDGQPDGGKTWHFTCAMFRIDPRSRRFEIFCEGTSNPWGIAFDENGSAFISACVIDHLWHLIETGYYRRQGGAYPPHTWKLESIVSHKHQKAAYCGITWFDSDAYPEEYRGHLYMGNIHGNCINSDSVARADSSYRGSPRPDFLSVEDAWFMPVVQKTGPDGCLYVLDWYDRYHCYQDANRDPKGIDRLKGRLYRIVHSSTPRYRGIELQSLSSAELLRRLADPNVLIRRLSQRLLTERLEPTLRPQLERMAMDTKVSRKGRLHALWTMIAMGSLDQEFHLKLTRHPDSTFRAWAVRAAGNFGTITDRLKSRIRSLARDVAADVRLQVAIAARKIEGLDAMPLLIEVLAHSGEDRVLHKIAWQNLHPLLSDGAVHFLELVNKLESKQQAWLGEILPRAAEHILSEGKAPPEITAQIMTLTARDNPGIARRCMQSLTDQVQAGQLATAAETSLKALLGSTLDKVLNGDASNPMFTDAALLAASWKQPKALSVVRRLVEDGNASNEHRIRGMSSLVKGGDPQVVKILADILSTSKTNYALSAGMLGAVGQVQDPALAGVLVDAYQHMNPSLRPVAVQLLTQRAPWRDRLLRAIETKAIPTTALAGNQVQVLSTSTDPGIAKRIRAIWGIVRKGRNPNRERVIAQVAKTIQTTPGDPFAGRAVFEKTCAQCHQIYGKGTAIGPDLTGNGRGSFQQLLTSVLDPNLVVGDAYQLRVVETHDDRLLSGMLMESNKLRVVVRELGGKAHNIPRKLVKEVHVQPVSVMPEGLESTLSQQDIANLFAFLLLDKPPEDQTTQRLPGCVDASPRDTTDSKDFDDILAVVAPGFHISASGVKGVGLLAEHLGRHHVVRTHPVKRKKPCVLEAKVSLPADRSSRLEIAASHHGPIGGKKNWEIRVLVNNEVLAKSVVGSDTTKKGWLDLAVDLSAFAGKTVNIRIENRATGWSSEFGYWQKVRITSK
ncbi:MAG: PVC-type heme-binding CxxCH protein [Planctomycetota bacterium]|nr:PVC-type heme-binding CxxCH protein [Planctomycetota bacterium]